jgi:iron complex outermembrane receptor protein
MVRKADLLATLSVAALAAVAAFSTPTAAFAEEAPGDGVTVFETLVVTARKREEMAQTVPISISAYGQNDIDRLNIDNVGDLRYSAPSVYVAQSTFRADTINVTIRGQRNFDSTGLQFDTAAALYVDGVYYARPVGLNGTLFDVDTVQVLKGPQGTLVGRNTTGGAILYETRKPTDTFGGYLNATLGDYDRHEIEGAINIPLGDKLAFRAAGAWNEVDGYIRNYFFDPASGYTNTTPAQGARKIAGNFSLRWKPDDSLSVLLRANISGFKSTGTAYTDIGVFEGTVLAPQNRPSICNIPGTCTGYTDLLGHRIEPYYSNFTANPRVVSTLPASYNAVLNSVARVKARGFWTTEQALSNYNEGHYNTYSAQVDKQFNSKISGRLTAAYRNWDASGLASSRGLPYATNLFIYNTPDYKSYQAEATLNGDSFDDRLKWTTGLFYFREESARDGDQLYLFLPGGNVPSAVAGRQITYTDSTRNGGENSSYAAYAQATYALRPDTRVTAGARYTVDERWALLASRTIRTPSSPALAATIPNGTYDPSSLTLLGISYAGQTRACALTNTAGVLLPLSQCSVEVDRTFKKPTWTLAIDHDLAPGALVYATARSGYRSGAINSGAINPAVVVAKPEEVIDYEVGIKSDWTVGGMPVRTNLAAYYTDYRNIQIQTSLPNVTIATGPGGVPCTQTIFNANQCVGFTNDNVTLNAREARIKGFEWDLMARPITGLNLNLAGSYIDAVYTDYTFSPPAGYLLPTGSTNLSGTPFPLPKWQVNYGASYTLPLTGFGSLTFDELTVGARAYWQSKTEADERPYNRAQLTDDYTLVNLRLDLVNLGGSNVNLAAFVTNATNNEVCQPESQGVLGSTPQGTFGVIGTSGIVQCLPLPPRMVGATLSYRF